jgi:hypothetical protein
MNKPEDKLTFVKYTLYSLVATWVILYLIIILEAGRFRIEFIPIGVLLLGLAVVEFFAARGVGKRKSFKFALVMSYINIVLLLPFGIILSVLPFIDVLYLHNEEVKSLFENK